MEHDSSRNGYHEPEPGFAGQEKADDWGDDFPKTFSVNLIWAEADDKDGRPGAIGFDGGMPWHLPEDMKRFKELTVSHPVIMGRRTWESLNVKYRPLPNRDNIVVSHNPQYLALGATVVTDLDAALDIARQEAIPDDGLDRSEIWVIGGAQVFQEALPFASKAFVTKIQTSVDADTYAPDMDALVDAGLWEGPRPLEENAEGRQRNQAVPLRHLSQDRLNRRARKFTGRLTHRRPSETIRSHHDTAAPIHRDDRVHGQHLPFAHGGDHPSRRIRVAWDRGGPRARPVQRRERRGVRPSYRPARRARAASRRV